MEPTSKEFAALSRPLQRSWREAAPHCGHYRPPTLRWPRAQAAQVSDSAADPHDPAHGSYQC